MAGDSDIKSGLWTVSYDHDRSWLMRPQILVEDQTSRYLIAWLAVLLGSTVPCVYILIRRLLLVILPEDWTTAPNTESKTLFGYLEAPGDEDNPLKAARAVWRHAGEGEIALPTTPDIWPAFVSFLSRTKQAFGAIFYDTGPFFSFIFTFFIFLGLFVGGVIVQVRDSDMANGYIVTPVSGSPNAGNWKPDTTSASFLHGEGSAISENRQRRIWEYKNACYREGRPDSQCEMFYKQVLPSTGEHNATCPFGDGACLYGKTGAYKRTTGLLDSNVLGVNAKPSKRVYIRKSMTCSPITTKGAISSEGPPDYPNNYLYDYGPWTGQGSIVDNYTYRSPMEWWLESTDDDAYRLEPYIYVPGQPQSSSFEPYEQFRAGNEIVSFFFIRTAGEWYHALESYDPIFPAHLGEIIPIRPGLRGLFWMNPHTQAAVLGCADTFEICTDKQGKKCWDQTEIRLALEELKDDVDKQRIFYFVAMALENTYAWRMVHYLQASVLNATRQAARIIDIRLAPEQWKIEVDNIFNASLAAAQLQAYDYARGTYSPQPNGPSMEDYTPSMLQNPKSNARVAVEISKMFKFKNNGYKNIPAFWFWFVNVGCVVVFLSSRRFSTKERRRQLIDNNLDGGYHDCLWITIFWHAICVVLIKKGWERAKAAPGQIKRKTLTLWGHVKAYFAERDSPPNIVDEQGTTPDEESSPVLVGAQDVESGTSSVADIADDITEAATGDQDDTGAKGAGDN